MAKSIRLLGICGSARAESFNARLLDIAADAARQAGAEVNLVDWSNHEMPLYNGDLEASEGIPEPAKALKQLMIDHDGFIFACPEYNSSITPLLKNAIDWASRAEQGESPLVAYRGKTAALFSASPGALGGLRGLVPVRMILSNIGTLVLADQVAVSHANEAFDASGKLKEEKQQMAVERLAKSLVETTAKLKV